MMNKIYDPQTESLMDFWNFQQERLSLLNGRPITDDVLKLTAAFGESEIMMFEKLMQTQKQLQTMLAQTSSPTIIHNKRISNPVLENLDLSDSRTVRRFEIHPYENVGGVRVESMIPSFGILILVGKKDSRTNALRDFFTGKGMAVKQIEKNLTEEEAAALIASTAEEGAITGLLIPANTYGTEDADQYIYEHTMTVANLIKHYTIYIRALKPSFRSMILFATFLDGKLGFTGENDHYAYGTFNGIAKTLSIEFGEYANVKLIDFEPTVSTEKMLEITEDELTLRDLWPEIGRTSDGKRWSVNGVFVRSIAKENRAPYNENDVIVVTGGSRGVTSHCVLSLMEKAPCKLIILGRAAIKDENMDDEESAKIPDLKEMKTLIARRFKAAGYKGSFSDIEKKAKAILAQREMLNTFRTLEATGCKVHYYSCDVNDFESLSQTVKKIESEVGPVRGIIHGAGLLADCKIWNKDMQRFRAVLDTKYKGLNNILSCVDKKQLKLVVAFSSVAGYFGNDGQMDYAAGNEFLDKFAHRFRKKYPNCKTLAINWGAWDGGMMDYIYRKTLTEKGYVLIPLEVGANYFANEILNGLPYGQILISNNDKPVDATRPAE
ncbi:MAG: SDR family NAD(P)-dependent oxidoreductase [Ruminococcaceae bacterium]|nr:SDR family NAD(P)-dependent oxidoreductase [Oscillospiraceae bacterium]